MPKTLETVLEIDLNALEHNFKYLKSRLKPDTKFLAVVKAFAYGSEATGIAKKMEALGIDYFAVAYTKEGIALRKAGIGAMLRRSPRRGPAVGLVTGGRRPRRHGCRRMIPVILESPYAAGNGRTVAQNEAYLNACIHDCLRRGESPYASHRMLTSALDDTIPRERELGIRAGFTWAAFAQAVVVYVDHGISAGMRKAICVHESAARKIEYRRLDP